LAFIELPDNFIATNQPVHGPALTAANVGARYGILGTRIPVQATPAFLQALAEMKITMTDQNSQVLGQATGSAILDQPIHALLWLIEDLNRSGAKLKPGDMISLGGVLQVTPQPGQNITVTYTGLPGGSRRALVRFD
jgi:2-keto-4-pentenoate hydratase